MIMKIYFDKEKRQLKLYPEFAHDVVWENLVISDIKETFQSFHSGPHVYQMVNDTRNRRELSG